MDADMDGLLTPREHPLAREAELLQDTLDAMTVGMMPVEGGLAEFDSVIVDIEDDRLTAEVSLTLRGIDGYAANLPMALFRVARILRERWLRQEGAL